MPIEPLIDALFWKGIGFFFATVFAGGFAAVSLLASRLFKADSFARLFCVVTALVFAVVFACFCMIAAIEARLIFAPQAVVVERLYQDQLETTRAAIEAGRIEKELER